MERGGHAFIGHPGPLRTSLIDLYVELLDAGSPVISDFGHAPYPRKLGFDLIRQLEHAGDVRTDQSHFDRHVDGRARLKWPNVGLNVGKLPKHEPLETIHHGIDGL